MRLRRRLDAIMVVCAVALLAFPAAVVWLASVAASMLTPVKPLDGAPLADATGALTAGAALGGTALLVALGLLERSPPAPRPGSSPGSPSRRAHPLLPRGASKC